MIKKYTCQNGVRVVLKIFRRFVPLQLGYGLEQDHEMKSKNNGVSHFLEHMFFKGTKTQMRVKLQNHLIVLAAR